MKKVSVSLLVFNEKHNLEKTIAKAYIDLEKLNLKFELWIVDNNSDDGTDVLVNSLLKKYDNLKYYKQKENFGYAVNFQTALKLPNSDYKFVVDGDGQYDLENAKECIQILEEGNDIIIGIRHPRKDPKDELDEIYEDQNSNGQYDEGEPFIDENGNNKWNPNNPPTLPDGFNGRHLLGTDNTGRDVFARVIDGFKVSITFAVICTFLSYSIGIIIGGTLGYFGGKVDLFGVRIMEIFSALPFLFIVMILSGFMQPNLFILASILVFLSGWIGISYFIRGEFYREKAKDYVSAAVSMGASNKRVMFQHILPNALTPIITFAPFAIIGYIGTLNMLDLLGYGLQPPAASWGEILKQALENLDNWHMLIFPIIAMTITLFMITFIGEAIREAFDPKVYSRLR